jgi:hypothetical protein
MIYIKLDKNIQCESICQKIQQLIATMSQDTSQSILVIDIKPINNDDTNLIPKLEYSQHNCTM